MYTLVFFAIIASATAHKVEFGACPKVDGVENFDMEKFQGIWYVIKKVRTSMSCVTDSFTSLPESGKYNYTEIQQLSNQVLIINEAEIKTREGNMMIDYPLVIPDGVFIVTDTDYENYAVIFKCQSFPMFRRWSASVLSRTPEMSTDRANELETKFNDQVPSLRNTKMSFIDWSNCVTEEEAQFTLGIGPELTFRPGGQVMKSVIEGFKGMAGDAETEDVEFF